MFLSNYLAQVWLTYTPQGILMYTPDKMLRQVAQIYAAPLWPRATTEMGGFVSLSIFLALCLFTFFTKNAKRTGLYQWQPVYPPTTAVTLSMRFILLNSPINQGEAQLSLRMADVEGFEPPISVPLPFYRLEGGADYTSVFTQLNKVYHSLSIVSRVSRCNMHTQFYSEYKHVRVFLGLQLLP